MINKIFGTTKDIFEGMIVLGNSKGGRPYGKTTKEDCSILFTKSKGNVTEKDDTAVCVRFSYYLSELFSDIEYVKIGIKDNKLYVIPCNIEDDGVKICDNNGIRHVRLNIKTRCYLKDNYPNAQFTRKEVTLVRDKSTKYFYFDIN
jgi:hypothetical protein